MCVYLAGKLSGINREKVISFTRSFPIPQLFQHVSGNLWGYGSVTLLFFLFFFCFFFLFFCIKKIYNFKEKFKLCKACTIYSQSFNFNRVFEFWVCQLCNKMSVCALVWTLILIQQCNKLRGGSPTKSKVVSLCTWFVS